MFYSTFFFHYSSIFCSISFHISNTQNYIKQYLLQKGIDKQLIEEQISLFYENNKNLEKENAIKFAKKRNLLNNEQDYQKKLSKMARAGFSYDIAKEILK